MKFNKSEKVGLEKLQQLAELLDQIDPDLHYDHWMRALMDYGAAALFWLQYGLQVMPLVPATHAPHPAPHTNFLKSLGGQIMPIVKLAPQFVASATCPEGKSRSKYACETQHLACNFCSNPFIREPIHANC